MKKIGIACDHAGYEMKEFLVGYLDAMGYEVLDFGTHSPDSVDYADFAHPLAEAIMNECEARGIVARMVEDFAAVPGRGVTARELQNVIAAGNVRLMVELGITVPDDYVAIQ